MDMDQTTTGLDSASSSTTPVVTATTEVKVVAAIFFFILLLFFAILYLYTKHVWAHERSLRRRRRRRLVFAAEEESINSPIARRGLDAAVLGSLPVTVFKSEEDELECAVCLCELADGEQVRLLPKCNHGFHLECIDMWFHSHSTCPLCRSPVDHSAGIPPPPPPPLEAAPSSSVPTGKAEGMLVIEIPRRRVTEGFPSSPNSPLPTSSRFAAGDEMKTPTPTATPTSARRRSLMRILSRGKRTVEGGGGDIEQGLLVAGQRGERSGLPPKSPWISSSSSSATSTKQV